MAFVVDLKKSLEDKHELGEYGHDLSILHSLKINIPNGFIITTDAYFDFIFRNNISKKVNHLLENLNEDTHKHIIKNILESEVHQDLINQIFKAYEGMGWGEKYVSLFPSPTDVDLKLKEINHIKGEAVLLEEIKSIWASFFEEELFLFRHLRELSHFKTGIAIVVLEDLPIQKEGYIEESKIVVKKGSKLTEKQEEELLNIENKILDHHYFSKRVHWIISSNRVYATATSPIAGVIEVKKPEEKTVIQTISYTINLNGGIATGVVGEEILIEDKIDYDKLRNIKHIKGLVVKKEVENPHIKIVLSQMGFPVVIDRNADFKKGMIVTVDSTKNTVYKGGLVV